MKRILILLPIIFISLALCSCQSNETKNNNNQSKTIAPVAKKVAYEMKIHGDTRVDDYYWMRDDERKDPEIIAHLNAEKAYTKTILEHTEEFQDKLFHEITGRIKKDNSTYPIKRNGYWYYSSYSGDQEYPIYYRKKGSLDAKEAVLLDGNILAKGHEYFGFGRMAVSPKNNLLAYAVDLVSRRQYDIVIKDLTTGKLLKDTLKNTSGNVVWANDNKTFFYIKKDPQTLLGNRVYRHVIGTEQKDDVLVYEEKDSTFYIGLAKSRDESLIQLTHDSTIKSGVSILDANNPTGNFKLIYPLEDHHEYSISKIGNEFYIRTNWQAKNFRLMKVDVKKASNRTAWKDIIPHRENIYFEGFEIFTKKLVIKEKEMGQSHLRVIDIKSKKEIALTFNDDIYSASISANPDINNKNVRISYTSLTTPRTLYDISLEDGKKTMLKQTEVQGGYNSENYKSERIFVGARDGKKVPVSILYRKDTFKKDGSNPVYQYAYGSYGSTMNPSFRSSRLSLLDRGLVFVIAHVRGSQMLGRPWYEDGKLYNKINTFTDFIDVTKAIVEQKYGAKDKIFAAGGSAGGLLIGAVANMNPELYKGLIAAVPFVDVVTTMLDASIPLTTNEYDEWGNPNEEGYYKYMLSYSPYDNVKKQNYPHMYVSSGLHDSQVQYFEPAKWVAKLRELKTDDNTLVFDINMDTGHGGSSGRFKAYKDLARRYAFIFDLLEIKE